MSESEEPEPITQRTPEDPVLRALLVKQRESFAKADAQASARQYVPGHFVAPRIALRGTTQGSEATRSTGGDATSSAVEDARDGLRAALGGDRGALVVLTGDPGSGKTFVLREIVRSFEAEGGVAVLVQTPATIGQLRSKRLPITLAGILDRHLALLGAPGLDGDALLAAASRGAVALLFDQCEAALPGEHVLSVFSAIWSDVPASAKAVIAYRSTAFASDAEVVLAMSHLGGGGGRPVGASSPSSPSSVVAHARFARVGLFDAREIADAVRRRFTEGEASERVAWIERAPEVFEVLRRPVFLDLFCSVPLSRLAATTGVGAFDALLWEGLQNTATRLRMDLRDGTMFAKWLWPRDIESVDGLVLHETFEPVQEGPGRRIDGDEMGDRFARSGFVTRDEGGVFSFFHPWLAEWLFATDLATTMIGLCRDREMDVLVAPLRARPMSPRMVRFFLATLARDNPRGLLANEQLREQLRLVLADERSQGARALRALIAWARAASREQNAEQNSKENARAILKALEDEGAIDRVNTGEGAASAGGRSPDAAASAEILATLPRSIALSGETYSVAFHPSGRLVATGHFDREARTGAVNLWEVASGECVRSFETSHLVKRLAWRPDGVVLAVGIEGGAVELRDMTTGASRGELRFRVVAGGIAWSPDGTRIAIAVNDGLTRVHDAGSLAELHVLRDLGDGSDMSVAWSRDGARIVTSLRRMIRIWDARDWREIRAIEAPKRAESLALSEDGQTIVEGDEGGTIRFWSADSGELVRSFRVERAWLREIAMSRDSKVIAIAANTHAVLMDARTGAPIHTLGGAFHQLWSVALSPDGRFVAAGMQLAGHGGATYVWDTATGDPYAILRRVSPEAPQGIPRAASAGGRSPDAARAPDRSAAITGPVDARDALAHSAPTGVHPLSITGPVDVREASATLDPRAPVLRVDPTPSSPALPVSSSAMFVRADAEATKPGDAVWIRRFFSGEDQSASALAIQSNGDISVQGGLAADVDVGAPVGVLRAPPSKWGGLLVTLDPEGSPRWAIVSPGDFLVAHPEGGVVSACEFQNETLLEGQALQAPEGQTFLLQRRRANGELGYVRVTTDPGFGRLHALAMDHAGRSVLGGYVYGRADFGAGPVGVAEGSSITGFVARFDARCVNVSTLALPGACVLWCWPAPDGATLLAGRFYGEAEIFGVRYHTAAESGRFLVLLDSLGSQVFSRAFDDDTYFEAAFVPPAADRETPSLAGDFYLYGTLGEGCDLGAGPLPASTKGHLCLARLDRSGRVRWQRTFASTRSISGGRVVVTPDGGALVSGVFTGDLGLGGGRFTSRGTGRNATPFLARFTRDGAHVWSRIFGDGEQTWVCGLAIADESHAIVAGSAAGEIDLGLPPLPGRGRAEIWVAKVRI